MQIVKNPTRAFAQKTAVALGNFDGFHRAHAALVDATCRYASENGLLSAAFSFSSLPQKGTPIFTEQEKLLALEQAGIDVLFLYDFDTVRTLSKETFVRDVLLDTLSAKAVFCGFNYRFAKDREGTTEDLDALLAGHAKLFVLPAVYHEDGRLISSSAVRAHLKAGEFPEAEQLLGHPYAPKDKNDL